MPQRLRHRRVEEVSPGVVLDCDEADRLAGIEILEPSKRLESQSTLE